MSAKARITADFATQGEVASRLGIPAARTAELRRQMHDLEIKMPDGSVLVVEVKRSPVALRNATTQPVIRRRATSAKKK